MMMMKTSKYNLHNAGRKISDYILKDREENKKKSAPRGIGFVFRVSTVKRKNSPSETDKFFDRILYYWTKSLDYFSSNSPSQTETNRVPVKNEISLANQANNKIDERITPKEILLKNYHINSKGAPIYNIRSELRPSDLQPMNVFTDRLSNYLEKKKRMKKEASRAQWDKFMSNANDPNPTSGGSATKSPYRYYNEFDSINPSPEIQEMAAKIVEKIEEKKALRESKATINIPNNIQIATSIDLDENISTTYIKKKKKSVKKVTFSPSTHFTHNYDLNYKQNTEEKGDISIEEVADATDYKDYHLDENNNPLEFLEKKGEESYVGENENNSVGDLILRRRKSEEDILEIARKSIDMINKFKLRRTEEESNLLSESRERKREKFSIIVKGYGNYQNSNSSSSSNNKFPQIHKKF